MPNTLSLTRYGNYTTSPSAGVGTVAAGASKSTAFGNAATNLWVTTAGGYVGRNGASSATFVASVYDEDGAGVPRTRLGYFATGTAAASYTSPTSGGAVVTTAISHSDNGPTNAALMVFAGRGYAIDLECLTNTLAHQFTGAVSGSISSRTSPGNPPPSSYGAYAAGGTSAMGVWLEGWANVAPQTPASNLAPSGNVTSLTPTFTADFQDLNGAYGTSSGNGVDTGDQLNAYHIQVRAVGTTTLLWDTTLNAGSTQKANNQANTTYAGSTLTRGTAYEWRIQMSDQFSAWSGWSAWTSFTPVSLGFVTLDNTPTGKVLAVSGSTALDFHGRWNHQTSATMTQAQVKLLDGNGTVLQTSPVVTGYSTASSALPGTLFTVTWAQTGFTALGWGRAYQYQIQGYDGTNWSGYSSPRSFTTDAAPTIPSGLTPTGGVIYTSFPLLACSFTDADDTSSGSLTGVFRITKPDTSTVDVTPTFDATSGKWEFQTTATQLTAFGTYSWIATGFDGTLYSGESTTLGGATWSASSTFQYQSGPVVSVSSPANNSTVTTASLTVTWSVTSNGPQAKYQVQVFADGTQTVIYDSGTITSTNTSHTIPSGFLHGVTATNYDLVVTITNTTPLTGASNIVNITVSFTPPTAPTNPQATAITVGSEASATAIQFSWDQTTYSTSGSTNVWQAYNVYRSADSGPDAAQILLYRITSPTQTSITDPSPASGATYTYSVTNVTMTGTDTLESSFASGTAGVTLTSNVFALVGNGVTYRANLTNVTARDESVQIVEAVYVPLGSSDGGAVKPFTVRSKANYGLWQVTGVLSTDSAGTAIAKAAQLKALAAQSGVIGMTNGRGDKVFGKILNLKLVHELPDYFSISYQFRQENYKEGS